MDNQINNQSSGTAQGTPQDKAKCCPKFDPTPWEGKTFDWDNKKFIKDKVFTLFYVPMNFGSVMKRSYEIITKSGGAIQGGMWLSDHTSKWNMDVYIAVDKEISGAQNTTMSGKFLVKVYEGKFKDTGIWMKDFEGYAKSQGLTVKKIYIWYTTCPKCAKKYGKNYVALVGQIN